MSTVSVVVGSLSGQRSCAALNRREQVTEKYIRKGGNGLPIAHYLHQATRAAQEASEASKM